MAQQLSMLESGWREALQVWNTQRAAQLEDGRRDLLRFALDITRRIVGELPERNPELVLGQVAQAMELLADRTRLRIRINGEDMNLLEGHLPGILAEAGIEADARIEQDESVPRGSCLLITPDGQVDGRFGTQLDRIVEGLLPELKDEEQSA
jgi:flagellar biosynthesis/type III secretory pathway protein FliH